jgi:hypothetical protein
MKRKNDYSLAEVQGKMRAQSNPASAYLWFLQVPSFDIKEGHCFCWNELSGRRGNNEVGTSATMDTGITS